MCRLLAYVGPPRTLSELLVGPPHSLSVQSYAPKEMEEALLNADGFGACWYASGATGAARYRSMLPMWADENFPDFSSHVQSGHVLASVRSATPGIGMGLANTQPYTHCDWVFAHNGYISDFRDGVMRAMRDRLSDEAYRHIRGSTDSEHLFASVLMHPDLSTGLQALPRLLAELAPNRKSLMSIVASDRDVLYALRFARNGNAPTLYLRDEGDDGVYIASEPSGEGTWVAVAEQTLLQIKNGRVHSSPLASR